VEDCADAIRYVLDHAEELGVDKERVLLSGFSAGGNLAAAGWLLATKPESVGYPRFEAKGEGVNSSEGSSTGVSELSQQSSSTSARTRTSGMPDRKLDSSIVHGEAAIRGIIAIYPLLDWASPQSYKLSHHPSPDTLRPLPPWLVNLFDTSYLPRSNPVDRHNPLISPGLAPDELLRDFPPIHQVLCERDLLLAEGQIFHQRLVKMGKKSTVRIVKGEKHGWDKPPHLVKPSVHEEYDEAFKVAKTWLEE
jgi:acetyl esterase/lipase